MSSGHLGRSLLRCKSCVLAMLLWLGFASYVCLTLFLLQHYSPKLLIEQPAATEAGVWLYDRFRPIWLHNNIVVPIWFLLALGTSTVALRQVERWQRQAT